VKAARGFYWAFIATVFAMMFATMMFTRMSQWNKATPASLSINARCG
jgi:hypothetical protein